MTGFFTAETGSESVFEQRNIKADILLEVIDADVIKTYVELGLGVGIIVGTAFDAERDKNLRSIPVGHLFGTGRPVSLSGKTLICAVTSMLSSK